MDYSGILQKVLLYIGAHIGEALDVHSLAAAGFSPYHFCRIFEFTVGYPVMAYVRNRRLAFAAVALDRENSILQIALDYGFETHAGFTKAFLRAFGLSPGAYRRHAHFQVLALPSLETMKQYEIGGMIMEPKFMTLPATKLVGYTITCRNNDGSNSVDIPAFWSAYMSDGRMETLHALPATLNTAPAFPWRLTGHSPISSALPSRKEPPPPPGLR